MEEEKGKRAESWKGLNYQKTKDRLMELDVPARLLKILADTPVLRDQVREPRLPVRNAQISCFAADGKPTLLTEKQVMIFRMTAFGLSRHDISMIMDLSLETIKTHKKNGLAALRVRNTIHAIAILVRQNVI